jgi:hypothetical protein
MLDGGDVEGHARYYRRDWLPPTAYFL